MNKMKQAHFFSIPTQGNLYTIKSLHLANDTNKLLVATLKRQVFCFEYLENSAGILIPTAKEISFTYIPSGAEIISLDAFNKSEDKNDFIIGITIIKTSNDNSGLETYLNIYSEWEESQEFNIESIAQNCLTLELNFIPYHLSHTFLVSWQNEKIVNKEIIFILTGSDNQIHIFKENAVNHSYKEIEGNEIFPEFYNPPSVVIWVDVYYYNNYAERVSAFGCECGYMRLVRVCCKTAKIIFNVSTRFISPISQLKIYPAERPINKPEFIINCDESKNPIDLIHHFMDVETRINNEQLIENNVNMQESAIKISTNNYSIEDNIISDSNIIKYESAIIDERNRNIKEDVVDVKETILGDSSAIQNKENEGDIKNIKVPSDEDMVQKYNTNLELAESEQRFKIVTRSKEYLEEVDYTVESVSNPSFSNVIENQIESSDMLLEEETGGKSFESSLEDSETRSNDSVTEETRSVNSIVNEPSSNTTNAEKQGSERSAETIQDVSEISTNLFSDDTREEDDGIFKECISSDALLSNRLDLNIDEKESKLEDFESTLINRQFPETRIQIEKKLSKSEDQIINETQLTTHLRNKEVIKDTSNPINSKDSNIQTTYQENVQTILNLVVVNAVLPSVVFNDIANKGLGVNTTLKRTEMVGVSACMEVADIDFDGNDEILLGSSGEDIKLYVIENGVAKLKEIKRIVSPVFNIQYLDITGDGVRELIIFTMRGVYIFQHEPEEVQRILKEKVKKLTIPNIQI